MFKQSLLALTLGFGSVASAQAAVLIDDFTDGVSLLGVGTGGASTGSQALTSNTGVATTRQIDAQVTSTTTNLIDITTITCTDAPGSEQCLSYSAGSGVKGTMSVLWDLGGVDLTDGGFDDALSLGINFSDWASSLAVTIISGATSSTLIAGTASVGGGIPGYPGTEIVLDYDSFTNSSVFTSVDSVLFEFNYNVSATDMELLFFGTTNNNPGNDPPTSTSVPVPASAALMLVGLMGLRRRLG